MVGTVRGIVACTIGISCSWMVFGRMQGKNTQREKAGTGFAIPEPSTANIAEIPFWIENIHPELVTFV